jgi:hypothetical protein
MCQTAKGERRSHDGNNHPGVTRHGSVPQNLELFQSVSVDTIQFLDTVFYDGGKQFPWSGSGRTGWNSSTN